MTYATWSDRTWPYSFQYTLEPFHVILRTRQREEKNDSYSLSCPTWFSPQLYRILLPWILFPWAQCKFIPKAINSFCDSSTSSLLQQIHALYTLINLFSQQEQIISSLTLKQGPERKVKKKTKPKTHTLTTNFGCSVWKCWKLLFRKTCFTVLFPVQSPATINFSCSCKYSVLLQIKRWGLKSATQKMRATCEKLRFSAGTGTALAEMLLHSCSAVTKAGRDSCLFCGRVFFFYYFILKENSKLFTNSGWIELI